MRSKIKILFFSPHLLISSSLIMQLSMEDWKSELKEIFGSRVKWGEPLSKHTTFGIGGAVEALIEVKDLTELQSLAKLVMAWQIPLLIIGRGSNMLVSDSGFRGLALKLTADFNKVEFMGDRVMAGAGVALPRLAKLAAQRGLSGLEFSFGIPGSVGGGLIMNAGAFDSDMSQVVVEIEVVTKSGEFKRLSKEEANFGYRKSGLRQYFCVKGGTFQLRPADLAQVKARMLEFYAEKMAHQPLKEENAGCIFKNPPGNSAGRLIDECGLKGARNGGAQVSDRHANFILNLGKAKASDVIGLIERIRAEVKHKKGIDLELEIELVGMDRRR